MIQNRCIVAGVREVGENIFVIRFLAPDIAATVRAGQFLNLKVTDDNDPLLRRPFSVYRADDGNIEIIFNVVGKGTSLLRRKRPGDFLDVLGPLGTTFTLSDPAFTTGILVAGGLGVAPLPLATAGLKAAGKSVLTFLGGRTRRQVVGEHLECLRTSTDDGSLGFHGTVVDMLRAELSSSIAAPKIFACGPTPMLRAVAEFALARAIPCEVSLEGPMGCGIGICQGCPVELADGDRKYALMCKDGPVFDSEKIRI
jgi:dihydroorotate dehydrogenase electron transfer subunit